jgi:MYXO-CTERM domain-containing protein
MRTFLLVLLLSARAAHADGWGQCGHCNAGGHPQGSVAAGLAVIAGVAYAVGRRRRR